MSTLLSCATGNFLTAATWALVDSTSFLNSEAGNSALTTTYTESQSFTPGAITIDGIAVKIGARGGTTGTFSVRLAQAGALVAGTEVTVDAADVAAATTSLADGGWFFFKFASPVTLAGATAYTVSAKNSTNGQTNLWRDATAGNWSRALRTTTTQAPAAGDDMIVAGEHTGQGTGNDIVVTMNETANTDYGSNTSSAVTPALAVCKRGTISWASGSAANPYLRLLGWCIVYNGGTLNIGTTGTPIPRDSVAVLEFQPASDGDRGFQGRNGSTVNLQGLSRTSGKNIDRCLLTADAPSVANLIETTGQANSGITLIAQTTALDPSLTSLGSFFNASSRFAALTDTAVNTTHFASRQTAATVNASTTQIASVWLRRGTGTNNRFARLTVGVTSGPTPTNGFFADIDLQAGTIGSCTALGTGVATASSITAVGDGYLCTITGQGHTSSSLLSVSITSASALGTVTYTGDATQNFHFYGLAIYNGSSVPLTLSVSADTGWLDGDVVAVASTTRTASDCEPMQLSANAGASSFTTELPPVIAHSGTSPTQAEVILLTRNVKIRSTSSSLMSFASVKAGCAFDADWAEFYYLGENVTDKRGVEFEMTSTNAANFNMQNCSIHDCEDGGAFFSAAQAASLVTSAVFSNNVLWNCATVAGPAVNFVSALNATNWEIDNNIAMRTQNGGGFTINDIGGKFTNNTAVGTTTIGFNWGETIGLFGNFTNNLAHSCTSNGVALSGAGQSGFIDGVTIWRCNSTGLNVSGIPVDLVLQDLVAFGNLTASMGVSVGAGSMTLKAPILNGDTSFSTASGINLASTAMNFDLRVEDGDLSTVSGIKIAHTQDINVSASTTYGRVALHNTKLGAATEVSTQTQLTALGFISSQRHDQTAGNHKTWMRGGALTIDTTIFNTASPSLRMTPIATGVGSTNITTNSGSANFTVATSNNLTGGFIYHSTAFPNAARIIAYNPLTQEYTASVNASASVTASLANYGWLCESAPFSKGIHVPVANGQTVAISVYTRRSAVGDGTAYVGLQPRLILKANPALGVATDTVLDTHTAADGSWEQLTGTTPAATDDGAFEFVVDCGGTAGWINVDDWAVT